MLEAKSPCMSEVSRTLCLSMAGHVRFGGLKCYAAHNVNGGGGGGGGGAFNFVGMQSKYVVTDEITHLPSYMVVPEIAGVVLVIAQLPSLLDPTERVQKARTAERPLQ